MEIKPNRYRKNSNQPDLFESQSLNTLRPDVEKFLEYWQSKKWLPKLYGTDRQASLIRDAMRRTFFRVHWQDALDILLQCSFLLFKKKPPFSLDWFVQDDNFDKVMEGKFLNDKKNDIERTTRAVLNDDGEEEIK